MLEIRNMTFVVAPRGKNIAEPKELIRINSWRGKIACLNGGKLLKTF